MAIRKTTKGKGRNFRSTKEGAGMTAKGVREYRKKNPGSKLKTAVTEKNPSKARAARRRSFCARSKNWKGEKGRAGATGKPAEAIQFIKKLLSKTIR